MHDRPRCALRPRSTKEIDSGRIWWSGGPKALPPPYRNKHTATSRPTVLNNDPVFDFLQSQLITPIRSISYINAAVCLLPIGGPKKRLTSYNKCDCRVQTREKCLMQCWQRSARNTKDGLLSRLSVTRFTDNIYLLPLMYRKNDTFPSISWLASNDYYNIRRGRC